MAKPFKCKTLQPEIVETIHRLVNEEGNTYEQIHDHIKAMGADVSQSGVARYCRHLRAQKAELEHTKELARELLDIGDANDLVELVSRIVALKLLGVLIQNDVYLDEDGISLTGLVSIGRTVATLQTARLARAKYDADMLRRTQEAADDVADKAQKNGLSPDLVKQIRTRVLGLGEAP